LPPEALSNTSFRGGQNAPPILAFDCSGPWCAAALLLGPKVDFREETMQKGQAERLMPLLEELLAGNGLAWRDLSAIAVGTGPGNFTGVRIAVAAARGLALGLGIPAVGVTLLEARAFGLTLPVTVVEDARRGEVYLQHFTTAGPGPARMAPAGFTETGSCVGSAAGPGALPPAMPLAEAIARIGAEKARTPHPRPAPFYLRGADAAPPADPPPMILP